MDETQFLQLIGQHQGIIHKICRLYRDRKEDREDLFQEIVFQVWKSVGAYSGKSTFATWLYKVALSTAIAGYRKRGPRIVYTDVLPDRAELRDNAGEEVFEVLRKLSDDEKAVITLYLEGLSYKEIGEVIGITESNVGVRLNRIKGKVQLLFKK
ncbi:RNA polymerase sigma factor [Chitinophaga sancti]|uniref:RNA polymerase sigma-70 factor, ECF subfamily n=1 Tax=Chitinophaga sancti TaxID=1004 RepID=A0A1K1R6J6_9BACT|nr:sigma-70 family RNA polymerase sigma factor [Chitinophaga sancti]WQD64169.1 sigma-70 family RNA polymerase sigma factor [Chitinophaga sancti]WQG90207.1 sigma-70 family RNA polymerase sigma factor [Chitinophaga sancti]SFW67775.1 RNA polymerase sigma-70 factor, ECF subfamily [Chitinophaga sancti]